MNDAGGGRRPAAHRPRSGERDGGGHRPRGEGGVEDHDRAGRARGVFGAPTMFVGGRCSSGRTASSSFAKRWPLTPLDAASIRRPTPERPCPIPPTTRTTRRSPNGALDQLFRDARSHNGWQDRPITDEQLHALYDLWKMGPTSANCSPARVVFVRTPEAKQRLEPALSEGNRAKTMTAPVDRDHRHGHGVLREAAAALPARRRAQLVRRQAGR